VAAFPVDPVRSDTSGAAPRGLDEQRTAWSSARPTRAIPDQDPARLTEINSAMAGYLATKLGVKVEYVPVTDYAASVSLFKTGDIDMVFFGGLTGVQARVQTPGPACPRLHRRRPGQAARPLRRQESSSPPTRAVGTVVAPDCRLDPH
jgi:ABC-type phosphate/phosphonate transport system substrate-binding protein